MSLPAQTKARNEPSWLKEWRRKKACGELPARATAHLRYGKFSRTVARSLELVRPPLSDLGPEEIARLEAKYEA